MIRSKDVNKEIGLLEDKIRDSKVETSDVLKALCLLIKLLRDVKTNQVLGLRKAGVELIKETREDETKEEK